MENTLKLRERRVVVMPLSPTGVILRLKNVILRGSCKRSPSKAYLLNNTTPEHAKESCKDLPWLPHQVCHGSPLI